MNNSGWFTLIGALLGFIGALIAMERTNRENTKRLQMQLEHDAKQRHLERERGVQRQIYLEVTEAIAQWQEYLGTFSMTNLPKEETGKIMEGASKKFSKGYIIGSSETISALNKLNLYFAKNAYFLSEKRYEFDRVAEAVQRLRADLNAANENVARATEANARTYWQKQVELVENELRNAIRQQDNLTVQLTKDCAAISNEFANEALDSIFAIRRELGMPLDQEIQDQFRQNVKEVSDAIFKTAAETMDRIKARFGIDAIH